jgi:penicillin amidase
MTSLITRERRGSGLAPRALLLLLFLGVVWATPLLADSLRVRGLRAPVEVVRDRWGVPHIYAANEHDLFFAQGFVQAGDRLYQMEVWKRAGQGRLAEVFGAAFIGRDTAARKLRYRGSMQAEYATYGPRTRPILTAFTAGINAYIALHANDLPREFALAGFRPEPWRAEDCLQRMAAYGLMGNADAELRNALLVRGLGSETAARFIAPHPRVALDPPALPLLEGLTPELLRDYVGSDLRIDVPDGSNNWTVSGTKSATGKPLLANDPHRTLAIPSLRYLVHLTAPGWDVIGAVEPALPGVGIGHNRHIAWGITVFPIDQQDLYVEHVRGNTVLTRTGWKRIRTMHETIAVKNAQPVRVTLERTSHGPIVWREGNRALALRWAGAEPGTAGYLASLAIDRATNWKEFLAACRRWKVPAENIVYADRAGNIGEQSAGLAPRRRWSGLLPVSGADGAHEWSGWIPFAELPRQFNPAAGFIATANDQVVPDSDRRNLGYAWATPFRIDRIREVLSADRKFTVAELGFLQNDVSSLAARRYLAALREAHPAAGDPAASVLLGWDGVVSAKSSAAPLYEVWIDRLRRDFLAREVPEPLRAAASRAMTSATLLERTEHDPALLLASLAAAWREAKQQFGDDPAEWRWGKIHRLALRHALDKKDASYDPAPIGRPGDGDTVNVASFRAPGFEQVHGASFREVLDVAHWDRSMAINVPGASGDPRSPHFADLLTDWARGDFFPLFYSRAAVERAAESTTRLVP